MNPRCPLFHKLTRSESWLGHVGNHGGSTTGKWVSRWAVVRLLDPRSRRWLPGGMPVWGGLWAASGA